MPPHSIGSGTISFGLVSIPIKLYTATSSLGVSFNLLHAKCGNRVRQQYFCPVDSEVVERGDLVKGYEFAKDQYVRVADAELKALEGEASKIIDIEEFVPLERVDPIYFEKTYYLGPDKGGEKAYRLLAEAMAKSDRVALAKFVTRGKETLVLIRAAQGGLMLHTMYFADEVRDFGEIDKGLGAKVKEGELELAVKLLGELADEAFEPGKFTDEYRQRVLDLVNSKVEGKEVHVAAPVPERGHVIDLMEALKSSLAKQAATPKKPPAKMAGKREAAAPAKAAAKAEPAPAKRAAKR
jgi:DNA end-binding protein Ku